MGLSREEFPGISELWKISESSVLVRTDDGRQVRVTVLERATRSELVPYYASYEELVEVTVGEGRILVWAKAPYASQGAGSVEDCLRGAVRWVAAGQTDGLTIKPRITD